MKSAMFNCLAVLSLTFLAACGSTKGSAGGAGEKAAQSRYEELSKAQDGINAEYSDGTSRQPRDPRVVSPRLLENPYFSKSLSYRAAAEESLKNMEWSTAYDQTSRGLVELNKFSAHRLIVQAEDLVKAVRRRGLDKVYPQEFSRGFDLLSKARSLFDSSDFVGSYVDAEKAVTELRKVYGSMILVNDYTVVLGDCLWRISLHPEIYNDAYRWPKIYMANRKKLQDPDNPDLIYPGQIFSIPR